MILDFANGKRLAETIFQAGDLVLHNGPAAVAGKRVQPEPRSGLLLYERPVALNKNFWQRGSVMVGDKIGVGQGVTIKKDQIFGAGGGDGEIEYARPAKAFIFLPQMARPKFLRARPCFENFAGIIRGTVVRQQHFVRQPALPVDRRKHPAEVFGLVVRVDDEGQVHHFGADDVRSLISASRTMA